MIRVAVILLSLAFLLSGCAGINQRRPPSLTLEIPPAFDNSTKIKRFNRGDYLYNNPPYWKKANCPITKISGLWNRQWENQSKDHSWSIQISLTTNEKVLSALNQAKDGYDAKKSMTLAHMCLPVSSESHFRGIAHFPISLSLHKTRPITSQTMAILNMRFGELQTTLNM